MKRIASVGVGGIALLMGCAAREHVLGGKGAPEKNDASNVDPIDGSAAGGSGGATSGTGGGSVDESGGTASSAGGVASSEGGSGPAAGGSVTASSGGAPNAGGSVTASSGGAPNAGGNPPASNGGAPASGGAGGVGGCTGACCPTDSTCYSGPANAHSPGAECLARIDNTPSHIQLRQTWHNPTAPAGNTYRIVVRTGAVYTRLPEPNCNTQDGLGAYIRAIDIDLTKGEARTGYVKYVTDAATALRDGLCFVDVGTGVDAGNPGWVDIDVVNFGGPPTTTLTDLSLPQDQMSNSDAYPPGLPAPMPQPWKMAPVKAKRLQSDFSLPADRASLLARFAQGGDLAGQYTGVFFYDSATGRFHEYAPLEFELMYDPRGDPIQPSVRVPPNSFTLVPIREAETTLQLNDPSHPNCVGRYNGEGLDSQVGCTDFFDGSGTPGWLGVADTKPGEGDAKRTGYFLITEAEQVFWRVLEMTYCVSLPTLDTSIDEGWSTQVDKLCRHSPKWDPAAPNNAGLPNGDWCAATNSPATATCHDAFRTAAFQGFQAYKLKSTDCTAL